MNLNKKIDANNLLNYLNILSLEREEYKREMETEVKVVERLKGYLAAIDEVIEYIEQMEDCSED
jgi:hypothetical protein